MRYEDHPQLGEASELELDQSGDIVSYHARFIYEPCTHETQVLGEVIHTIDDIEYQLATCQACGLSNIVLRIKPNSELFYKFLDKQLKANK